MKRSMQEVVELVIFALIALLVGTGVVWLAGWMLGLVGTVLTWLAGLVWSLLRFLVPIAVVAGAVYLLVKLMNRSAERVAGEPQKQPATPPSPWTMSKEPEEASGSAAPDAGEASASSPAAAASGSAPEADAAPDTSSVPSTPEEPKPPATNRWEGEGGSVTNGDEAGDEADDEAGDSPAASDDEARDEGDEKGGDEDDERRHGGEPS